MNINHLRHVGSNEFKRPRPRSPSL